MKNMNYKRELALNWDWVPLHYFDEQLHYEKHFKGLHYESS